MAKQEDKYSKLIKNTAIFAIANFGSNILRFIIVPFYTYYLTTSEYGIVDTLTTTVNLIIPIMLLAIQEAVLRFTLNKKYNNSSVLKSSLIIFLCGSTVFLLGYIPFKNIELFDGLWWIFYILIISSAFNNILLNYTRGSGKSITFMCGGIINTFVMLSCNVILLAVFHKGIKGYLFALTLGYMISSLFLLIRMKPFCSITSGRVESSLIKKMLNYSIPLIPTAAMWWIMNVSDRYLITYMIGVSFTGVYAVSNKIPTIISMCYAIFQQAWQISAVEEVEAKDRGKFYTSVYDFFFRGLFLIASITIIIIKPLLTLVVSSSYTEAWKYAPILVISAVFSSMAGFLGVNYMASEKTMGSLKTAMLGAVSNICLNIILIPIWGIQGAVIATLISFYVVWIVRATISNGGVKIKQNYIIIHILFGLELLQSIILLGDYKYQYVFQLIVMLVIILINKCVILKSIKICKTMLLKIRH